MSVARNESIAHFGVDAERRQQITDLLENRMARAILGWASIFQYQEGGEGEDAYLVSDYLHGLSGFDDPLKFVEVPVDVDELAGEVIALVCGGVSDRAVA